MAKYQLGWEARQKYRVSDSKPTQDFKAIQRLNKILANELSPLAKKRKAIGKDTKRKVFESQNHKCAYCGVFRKNLTVDHVIPLLFGGVNDFSNLVGACYSCNQAKGSLDGYTFYALIHPDSSLAHKLGEAFKLQPTIKSRMASILAYVDSIHRKRVS